jgi:hypothetical protein
MLLFRRPGEPKGFSKHVAPARRAVRLAVAAGQKLDQIPEVWREEKHKRAFSVAQHGKCGYCETFALNHPAAMEHHAPKGELQVLVAEGSEAEDLYNVRDRETPEISATGFHWLALAWDNWLLACERCNTGWKRSLFPVREDVAFLEAVEVAYRLGGIEAVKALLATKAPRPPHPRRKLTPLLLNPFGPEDPVDHLDFGRLGGIAARNGSDHGRETIRTCALHRESLRRIRQGIAMDAFRHVERLTHALAAQDLDAAGRAVHDLLSIGGEDRAHAGMVRCIVLSQLALRWPQLEALAKKLALTVPPPNERGAAAPVRAGARPA